MIEYKRHFPSFFDRDPDPTDRGVVKNVDELLALDWVKAWHDEHQDPRDPNLFESYCWNENGGFGDVLMVQLKTSHWVIAYLRGPFVKAWRDFMPQWVNTSEAREARKTEEMKGNSLQEPQP